MVLDETFPAPSIDGSSERAGIKVQLGGQFQGGNMWVVDPTHQVIQSDGRKIYQG
jgi:hypothetical protein